MSYVSTSAFRGFSAPVKELIDSIHELGWSVDKVDLKGDEYKASAKSPNGDKVDAVGPTDNAALGHLLMDITRQQSFEHRSKIAKWEKTWDDELQYIAMAYAEAPVYDPKAVSAWKELADDSEKRAEQIAKEIQIELVNDPVPYLSIDDMIEDVRDKSKILISTAATEHPLWSSDEVLAFRLVHNVIGHCAGGGDWGWKGENLATAAHMSVLDPIAQKALFTETIGQSAFTAYYGANAQKIAFLDELIEEAQKSENKAGWGGTHPSQTVLPGKIPSIEKEAGFWDEPNSDQIGLDDQDRNKRVLYQTPCPQCGSSNTHSRPLNLQSGPSVRVYCDDCQVISIERENGWTTQNGSQGWRDQHEVLKSRLIENKQAGSSVKYASDPNEGWRSLVDPMPDNAYLWTRDAEGKDPLDVTSLRDNATKLDTKWMGLSKSDGSPDNDSQKQAVANAFRAILLAPRKSLRDAITHYQDIAHLPATVDDPIRYWKTLEARRDDFNKGRGLPSGFHRQPWALELQQFRSWIKGLNPELDDEEVYDIADRQLFHMICEEEERLESEEKGNEMPSYEIEEKALKGIQKRLKKLVKPNYDEKMDFGDELARFASAESGLYPSFLVSRLKPIAAISYHLDEIYAAALEDASNGGSGHLFRSKVLNLDIPGIGPQEASYAWMMLAPKTSELAVIDNILAEMLGYKEQPSERDYFKLERQLAAGRDAAGYGHIPLGQFGWALWNNRQYGMNTDYSALRAINPSSRNDIDWDAYPRFQDNWQEPEWWRQTQDVRDMIGKHWDRTIAPSHPSDTIPKLSKVSAEVDPALLERQPPSYSPWFVNNGEESQGEPGQTLMRYLRDTLGLSTQEIWALEEMELGKRG